MSCLGFNTERSTRLLRFTPSPLSHTYRHSWPFLTPVKRSEAPGYYDVIKHPMDMGSVLARLESDTYQV